MTYPDTGQEVVLSEDTHFSSGRSRDWVVRLARDSEGMWYATSHGKGLVCVIRDTHRLTEPPRGSTIIVDEPFEGASRGVYADLK